MPHEYHVLTWSQPRSTTNASKDDKRIDDISPRLIQSGLLSVFAGHGREDEPCGVVVGMAAR